MNSGFELTVGALWALTAGGIAWCCIQAARGIVYVTLADGQRSTRRMPLLVRLLLPLTPNITPVFDKPFFNRSKQAIGRKIVSAGLEDVLTPADFLALNILVPIVLGLAMVAMLWMGLADIPGRYGAWLAGRRGALSVLAILLACTYSSAWLSKELAVRHRDVQRALPFVLDLLTLSVEAGMDFMSALQRIVNRQKIDPLCEELIRVLREIQLGKTRRQALRDMSDRVNQSDVRSVTSALVQADEMGVSIGTTLRIQADQMRGRRFQRAEKMAYEAPVKMLFPLIFFIFPAVFIVLLGPVFLEMARQWN